MKKINRIAMEVKKGIVEKYEGGLHIQNLPAAYRVPRKTVSMIVKNREVIKLTNVAKGVKSINEQRSGTIKYIEKLLLIWITEKQCAGYSKLKTLISKKTKLIHADLLNKAGTNQDN